MSTTINSPGILMKAIADCVRAEINNIAAEEFKKATQRAEERIRAEIDRISLSLLSEYNIEKMGQNLVITVRKELQSESAKIKAHER